MMSLLWLRCCVYCFVILSFSSLSVYFCRDFTWNKSINTEILLPIEWQLEIRTVKFLQAFSATTNTLCCCLNIVQSRSSVVYFVNINQMSFVALANWHAYCIITYELICSTLCTLCTMFCVFVFDFCAFVLSSCLIATNFLMNKILGSWCTVIYLKWAISHFRCHILRITYFRRHWATWVDLCWFSWAFFIIGLARLNLPKWKCVL